jgi:SAM-dependent methyltransferase
VPGRFLALQGDELQGELVFRAYVPFRTTGARSQSGIPLAVEYRTLILGGRLVQRLERLGYRVALTPQAPSEEIERPPAEPPLATACSRSAVPDPVPDLVQRLEDGINALDLGCGRGLALLAMAGAFPRSRFTGYDLGADAVAFGQCEAEIRDLRNIRFAALDAAGLDEAARYDLICTFAPSTTRPTRRGRWRTSASRWASAAST